MSDTEQLPHKKGGGGLILVGILLLLAAGGLVYFKLQSTDDDAPVTEEVKTTTQVEQPTEELADPPPPPPPEEEEEEEKPQEAVVSKPKGPSGCAGPCNGSASAQLQSALRGRGGQARGCYNRALTADSTLEGRMTVAVRISPSGGVCSASVQSDSVGSPAVSSCVLQKFRSGKYPAPSGGCVDTAIPLNFVKK